MDRRVTREGAMGVSPVLLIWIAKGRSAMLALREHGRTKWHVRHAAMRG